MCIRDSYMAEAFRSGLESVDKIQTESAYSLGMNKMQAMRYVILPQAMSVSIPAFVANVIFLMKETSVFSAISLLDLMFMAKDLMGMYNDTTEALCLLVGFYPVSYTHLDVYKRQVCTMTLLPKNASINCSYFLILPIHLR